MAISLTNAHPSGPVNQQLLLQQLRWRLLRNAARGVLGSSPMRLLTILLCSALIWAGVFAASAYGFGYMVEYKILLSGAIVGTLFDFLFLGLAVMLIFSGSIILYGSLFLSAESRFLLSTPAAADQVFAYKFQGAIVFSSWAFVLLGSPILIAYGLAYPAPWYFYVLMPLFFLGFVLLPGSLGALICLLVVNFVPRQRKQVLIAGGLVLIGAAALIGYQLVRQAHEITTAEPLKVLLSHLAPTRGPLAPNHWMTRGLQAAARGDLVETLYPLALVWSNGLFFYMITAWAASRLYRRGLNRLATGGTLRRRYGGGWLDQIVTALMPIVNPQTRLLIVKDFRTFRRDPAQWTQILIFAGLLLLYFTNIRRFYQEDIGKVFQNGVSLLNLAATALLLCAYTGRFIYPMLSLEGRKFWILGLLPLQRDRLLWGKFAFSAIGALLTAESLIVLSDVMLGMPGLTIGLHALTVAVLAVGFSGLSVGLGASMPNFRETDPSKIAIGFGGTLNLVACLLFEVVVLVLMAVPWHFYVATVKDADVNYVVFHWWLVAGILAGIGVGAAATIIPLRLGIRALRRMEF